MDPPARASHAADDVRLVAAALADRPVPEGRPGSAQLAAQLRERLAGG
jgi:hypothetical protein